MEGMGEAQIIKTRLFLSTKQLLATKCVCCNHSTYLGSLFNQEMYAAECILYAAEFLGLLYSKNISISPPSGCVLPLLHHGDLMEK
ncbi:hypothetical protein FKM82_030111 [Ascaphus truei]